MEKIIIPCGDDCKKTNEYEKRCKELCSEEEFSILKKAFFEREINLNL